MRTCSQSIICCDSCCGRIDKQVVCIAYGLVVFINLSLTYTNLTVTRNRHLCIAKHTSELTTTDDGFHDEGRTTNGHIGTSHV